MRITVVGSWRPEKEKDLQGTLEGFSAACQEIGRELARRNQTVVVSSDRPHTSDFHVVRGMADVIRAVPDSLARIEVIRAAHEAQSYMELANTIPRHISFPPASYTSGVELHLLQIKEADAVITIAGTSGTYQAGIKAGVSVAGESPDVRPPEAESDP